MPSMDKGSEIDAVFEDLERKLKEEDETTRSKAIMEIVERGKNGSYYPELVGSFEGLLKDDSDIVKMGTALALKIYSKHMQDEIDPKLLRFLHKLTKDKKMVVRVPAINALGALADIGIYDESSVHLMNDMLKDDDPVILASAANALGVLADRGEHDPNTIPSLNDLLKSKDPVVRANAAISLIKLADKNIVNGSTIPLLEDIKIDEGVSDPQTISEFLAERGVDLLRKSNFNAEQEKYEKSIDLLDFAQWLFKESKDLAKKDEVICDICDTNLKAIPNIKKRFEMRNHISRAEGLASQKDFLVCTSCNIHLPDEVESCPECGGKPSVKDKNANKVDLWKNIKELYEKSLTHARDFGDSEIEKDILSAVGVAEKNIETYREAQVREEAAIESEKLHEDVKKVKELLDNNSAIQAKRKLNVVEEKFSKLKKDTKSMSDFEDILDTHQENIDALRDIIQRQTSGGFGVKGQIKIKIPKKVSKSDERKPVLPKSMIESSPEPSTKYELIEKISIAGGYSNVYEVVDKELPDKVYALKLPKIEQDIKSLEDLRKLDIPKDELEIYKNEANRWFELTNNAPECVVKLIEIGDRPCPWFVMELADGSLRQYMRGLPEKPDPNKVSDIMMKLVKKLKKIHEQGIVHGDIKPENILQVKNEWKFTDFGLSKRLGRRINISAGTIQYMAPEQLKKEETDVRTDVWQMGVLSYELLTGELPFKGDDQDIRKGILEGEPKLPRELNIHIWPKLENAILKALKKDKEKRYQTAHEMWLELDSLKSKKTDQAIAGGKDTRTRLDGTPF